MSAAVLAARAPAKVNLTLRVRGRSPQGWHDLASLVAFAGISDHLRLTPGADLSLAIGGSGAAALAREAGDNIVLRAAKMLATAIPGLALGRFDLEKRLPIAAGIGGGSADAAAALRLLARHNGLVPDHPALLAAARAAGADVTVCLMPRGRYFFDRGDRVTLPIGLPPLPAVLVNPGMPLSTGAVFASLGLDPGDAGPSADRPEPPHRFADAAALLAWLADEPNDLEPPAFVLLPQIVAVVAALRDAAGCRLARMSGSGATVFGLFADPHAATAAARRLRADHPAWWVVPTILR